MSAVTDLESPTIVVGHSRHDSVDLVKGTCDAALAPVCFHWQFFIFHGSEGPSLQVRNESDGTLFDRGVSKLLELDLSRPECRLKVLSEIDRFAVFLAARLVAPSKYTFTSEYFILPSCRLTVT